jgi:hypothetical protein
VLAAEALRGRKADRFGGVARSARASTAARAVDEGSRAIPPKDGDSKMTSINHDYLRFLRTPDVAAWVAFSEEDQRWHVEVFARTSKGVEYLETEYDGDQPTERQLVRDAFLYGFFSARPCRLEHRFDPSMTHAVIAMLHNWCQSRSVDVQQLLKVAYADEPERVDEDFEAIVAQAEWEGIEYPAPEDRYQTRRLLLALRDVGYDKLAAAFVPLARLHG